VPPGDDALSERIAILEERMKTIQAGLSASRTSSRPSQFSGRTGPIAWLVRWITRIPADWNHPPVPEIIADFGPDCPEMDPQCLRPAHTAETPSI